MPLGWAARSLLLLAGVSPTATDGLFYAAFFAPPIAITVAVLRYRLYAVDRLVSRTATYAALSALVIGVFLGGSGLLAAVLEPLLPGSPLPTAAATLAAVGIVAPARRRIQMAVDRRFDRRRYDALQELEAFRGRVRDEVGLEGIASALVGAADTTVRPVTAGLWLRPVPGPAGADRPSGR